MITVEKALELIAQNELNLGFDYESYKNPKSSITQENIIADRDYPPFDRVMMDGIAVDYQTYKEGLREFKILDTAAAGEPQKELTEINGCLEIMTGAPLCLGASLVIQYEHIEIKNGIAFLNHEADRKFMDNIHLAGSDIKKGEILLEKNSTLNGPHWGIATSVGHSKIKKQKSPRINLISTGDELVSVDETPLTHQIRTSNIHALRASLSIFGYEQIELSHLKDNEEEIRNHYQQNRENFDVFIYSGGVSKGKFDYLPKVWSELGISEIFHGISQRPGKPLWFGIDKKFNNHIFGLPGNPVSSLVCLHRYFLKNKEIWAELTEDIKFDKKLTYFLPVKIEYTKDARIKATPLKIKNSGEFSALAQSDGFIELPLQKDLFKSGETYRFHSWKVL